MKRGSPGVSVWDQSLHKEIESLNTPADATAVLFSAASKSSQMELGPVGGSSQACFRGGLVSGCRRIQGSCLEVLILMCHRFQMSWPSTLIVWVLGWAVLPQCVFTLKLEH